MIKEEAKALSIGTPVLVKEVLHRRIWCGTVSPKHGQNKR